MRTSKQGRTTRSAVADIVLSSLFVCGVMAAGVTAATAATPPTASSVVITNPEDGSGDGSDAPAPYAREDLGCQVLMCMSNPAGPTAVSECKPPIDKLRERLAKGKSFPTCDMGGEEDQNYARQNGDYIYIYVDGRMTQVINWKTGEQSGGVGSGGPRVPSPDPSSPVQQIR